MRRNAQKRALRKGLPFDPDILDDIIVALELGLCQLSDIPFLLECSGKGCASPFAPSLDRIEPELGYVRGNIRVVLLGLNLSLSNWGQEAMETISYRYLLARRPDLIVPKPRRRVSANDNQLSLFEDAA